MFPKSKAIVIALSSSRKSLDNCPNFCLITELVLNHPSTCRVEIGAAFDLNWLPFGQQIKLSAPADLAINAQRVESGVAIHMLCYDYDQQQDQVPVLDKLNLELRLPGNFSNLEVFSPSESPEVQVEVSDGLHRLVLKNIPLYSIILLKEQPVVE